jgi:type VI secretion system Hcp family effector
VRLAGVSLACGALSVADVCAATDYTLTVEGVTSGRVLSLGFGHSLSNSTGGGGVGAVHGDLHVVKPVDPSSYLMMEALCKTQHLSQVRLEAIEQTPTHVRYYAIRMHDVLVSSYGLACASGDITPVEHVTLNYQTIEWTAIETDAAGLPGHALSTAFSQLSGTGGASDPDSDGDGLPDSYEAGETLKLLMNDADEDRDQDGTTNLKEYQSGTAAGDPTSVFRFTGIIRQGSGGDSLCTITFNSVPGRVYDLYASSSLTSVPVFLETVAASEPETSVDLTLPEGRAFVRVSVRVP